MAVLVEGRVVNLNEVLEAFSTSEGVLEGCQLSSRRGSEFRDAHNASDFPSEVAARCGVFLRLSIWT